MIDEFDVPDFGEDETFAMALSLTPFSHWDRSDYHSVLCRENGDSLGFLPP